MESNEEAKSQAGGPASSPDAASAEAGKGAAGAPVPEDDKKKAEEQEIDKAFEDAATEPVVVSGSAAQDQVSEDTPTRALSASADEKPQPKARMIEPGPVTTAVVGYGYAGRSFHSYLVSLEPGLKLTSVASRDPQRRAAAEADYRVKTYETLDELLEKDDARLVIIATPHDSHEQLVVKALEAGRHVVVDKAMCLTTAEADHMIEAAEKNGVMLSVFHNRRWDGDYLTLRRTIESGMLGEVFLVEECVMGYHQPGRWRGIKAQGGGPLYDWGAHLVDHAVQIGNSPPAWVFCETMRHKWTSDVETYVKCLIKFRTGLLYSVEVGYMAKYSKPKFFALGTEGAFRKEGLDPQEGFMNQKRIQESKEDPQFRAFVRTTVNGLDTEIRPETVRGDWCAYYRNIAAHLTRGEELAVKPQGVRDAIRVTEAAMKSAREKQAVAL